MFLLMRVSKLRITCPDRMAGGVGRPNRDLVRMAQLLKGPPGKACIENIHCEWERVHAACLPACPSPNPPAKGIVTSGTGFEALQLQIHTTEGAYGCPF